jgi:glycosyltransferase involved in cell wall biosynthesis
MIVTVVTPTYNSFKHLEECITSVCANAATGIEIDHVIVDAGSTDGTVELAHKFGLRVIRGETGRGIFDAINSGSFTSSGELLGFIGSDDVMLPGALARVVEAYVSSRRRWVVGGIRWIDENGRSLGNFSVPPQWLTTRMCVCLGWNPIMHMATYFSHDFFSELGGFDPTIEVSGDYEMFSRALAIAPFEPVKQPISCFRRTGFNNSLVNGARAHQENARILLAFGPQHDVERRLWRYFLKAWFNLANPRWSTFKMAGAIERRLNPQARRYF